MKEIDQFKSENGNVNYSVKELLGALHIKVDGITVKLEDNILNASRNEVELKNLKKIVWFGLGICASVFVILLEKVFGG